MSVQLTTVRSIVAPISSLTETANKWFLKASNIGLKSTLYYGCR